jgi:hypothetical protein
MKPGVLHARLAATTEIAAAARAATYSTTYSAAGRSRGQVWDRARDAERVRLREVIANACLTFPR